MPTPENAGASTGQRHIVTHWSGGVAGETLSVEEVSARGEVHRVQRPAVAAFEAEDALAALDDLVQPLYAELGFARADAIGCAVNNLNLAIRRELIARLVEEATVVMDYPIALFVTTKGQEGIEATSEIPKLDPSPGFSPDPSLAKIERRRHLWCWYCSPWWWLTVSSTIAAVVSMRRLGAGRSSMLLIPTLAANVYTFWMLRPGAKRGRRA